MDQTLFTIAAILFLASPVVLILGLIKPALFKKVTRKKSRKRIVVLAIAVFAASMALGIIFEPESVKQERAAREQAATSQEQKPKKIEEPKEQPHAKVEVKPVKKITPQITAIYRVDSGYAIAGYGQPEQLMELQTGGEKYKVTPNKDGYFRSENIESFLPYGKVGLYKLEKKSFLRTSAVHKQTKYYTLFANKPKLSRDKLSAHITQVKKYGSGFKIQGFYLANTKLTLWDKDNGLGTYTTNEDGFFVFTGLPSDPEVMNLTLLADGDVVLKSQYVYTPALLLLKRAPVVKVKAISQEIPYAHSRVADSSLTKGLTRVVTSGRNGQKKLTYALIFIDGKQVQRKLTSQVVTKQPVKEVTKVGTYVKPTPSPSYSSGGSGYTNVYGNYVPSPSSNPAGASAQCADGTYSYSQSRRGTCSHHGGVAVWY